MSGLKADFWWGSESCVFVRKSVCVSLLAHILRYYVVTR